VRTYYSKGGGLREWVKQNWVDIANKRKDGSYPKCGRSGGEKRKNYPKCVPIAKARAMSKGQRAGAVKRKMRRQDKQPPKTKKYFRSTKSGAGMTKAGVARYRRDNPGSKLKTAVTGKVKPGSKAAKRRKSFCARSLGQMKKFPKAAADPNSRLRQARRRWKC
jgi:hypothetical protein